MEDGANGHWCGVTSSCCMCPPLPTLDCTPMDSYFFSFILLPRCQLSSVGFYIQDGIAFDLALDGLIGRQISLLFGLLRLDILILY
jgi:hypothetical protein